MTKEISAEANPDGPQFFTSEQRPAATIWARLPGEIIEAATRPQPATSIVPPLTEQLPAETFAPVPVEQTGKSEWAGYGYEPPSKYQRPFWAEPEVRRPRPAGQGWEDHDTLPPVVAPVEKLLAPDVRAEDSSALGLEQAVDPNATSEQPALPDGQPSGQQAAPRKGLLARRRARATVQSEPMEGISFEQTAEQAMFANDYAASPETADFPERQAGIAPVLPTIAEAVPANSIERTEQPQPEETNHAAVFAERRVEQVPAPSQPEHVMQQGELLELAKAICVDGVSAHEMFTAGRIDEEGLRRIVVAYLRGGELRQLVSQEIVRQQMKFERDPQLRSTPVKHDGTKAAGRAATTIKQRTKSLLDVERALDRTARLVTFTHEQAEKAQEFLQGGSKVLNALGIAAIFVIYTTILVIILKR